jgi:hypothetical protein
MLITKDMYALKKCADRNIADVSTKYFERNIADIFSPMSDMKKKITMNIDNCLY